MRIIKGKREKMKKLLLCYLMIPVILIGIFISPITNMHVTVYAQGTNENTENGYNTSVSDELGSNKDYAVSWLSDMVQQEIVFDDGLPNMCSDSIAILRTEGKETSISRLDEWISGKNTLNTDELAHLIWAYQDEAYINMLQDMQNEDGGFGLDESYTSDAYDTMLALCAIASMSDNEAAESMTEGIVNYIESCQNSDGGFGYNGLNVSNASLSADIGLALLSLNIDCETLYEAFDEYILSEYQGNITEENFEQEARIIRYLYTRGIMDDSAQIEQQLLEIPQENGSIYDDVGCTIQYILLCREINEYHKIKFTFKSMITVADTYVLEVDEEQEVNLETTINYQVNQNAIGVIKYTLTEDGISVWQDERECEFNPDGNVISINETFVVTALEDKEYLLCVELVTGENEEIISTEEIEFYLHKTESIDLVLQGEINAEDSSIVNLTWNDVSTDDDIYYYRLLQSKEGAEWTSLSTWDGGEKVRVLNIYPNSSSKNYLEKWMTETISDTETPAGMDLFEIDTVFIDDYNKDPDMYLLDEDGNYKYDVLMFGTSDSNSNKDLNSVSLQATKDFINSGRGVLFGHDTVRSYFKYFSEFADDLGLILEGHYTQRNCTKVKVVNSGLLTSYPWTLSGILTIPTAHTQGQYSGGTLASTVWMEFQTSYDIDAETQATTAAYLSTNNQLALIQTGHSNGAATDDERKIIANTLFYLKQTTGNTSAEDRTFVDEAAPEVVSCEMNDNNSLTISGKDYGTNYSYKVEAIPENSNKEKKESNIYSAESVSGLKGFIVGISDSEDEQEDLLTYDEDGNLTSEILKATNDLLYDLSEYDNGTTVYIHIFAVDNAGNISEEYVKEITVIRKVSNKEYFELPYALFAENEDISLCCSSANISGDIYGKSTFFFQGSTLSLAGTASTTGTLSISGGLLEIAGKEEGIDEKSLPDYMDVIISDMDIEGDPLNDISIYNSTDITTPTLCNSSTGAWCSDLKIMAGLVSETGISINANTVSCGDNETKVVLGSMDGDITIQATILTGNGLIYAPNGTVTINVSEFEFTGSIVAKKIVIQAGTYNQNR